MWLHLLLLGTAAVVQSKLTCCSYCTEELAIAACISRLYTHQKYAAAHLVFPRSGHKKDAWLAATELIACLA